jgi:two-component system response regulator DegU
MGNDIKAALKNPMKILIVEDNPTVRRLIRRAVTDVASEIEECEDGADVLRAYGAQLPDIVLMDVRMPRLNGLAATRLLLNSYPGARVLFVTDYDDDELRHAASEAGACGFALKNNLTELEAIVESICMRNAQ